MILDITIHDNARFLSAGHAVAIAHPALEDRCDLGFGLWIGRISGRVANAVMDLCDEICVGTMSPVRQYAQLYAFVREVRSEESLVHWDRDNQLKECVALSRLIHPTSTGFKYAARVRLDSDGQPSQLCRAVISGINAEAHVSPSERRDWLTAADAKELVQLMASARIVRLPRRVSNALWYHEFAFRTWFADVRWTLICTALEALLNTSDSKNKRQFVVRSTLLASELGMQFSEEDAAVAYQVRSKLAHGEQFLYGLPQAELRIYDQMESILRACILRAFRDSQFAAIFATSAGVDARWPI